MDFSYSTSSELSHNIAMDAAAIMAQLTPPTVDPTTTIKMEDLHQTPFTSTAPPSTASASSPAPTSQEGKAAKKRKSWGQVLPEPKTNLPPRKRAKTDDEKEQRRIERVKRNRLAAHNSRERKRQEYELLQAEKDQMEADLIAAQRQIAAMATELKAYRQKYPGEVPQANLDIDLDNTSVSEYSAFTSQDTINPAKTTSSTGFPSPDSMTMDSFDSPRDSSCAPETPNFSGAAVDFDQTRYPAEILCDLQCRSTSTTTSLAIWAFLSLFNLTLPWTTSLLTTSSTSTSSRTPTWELLRALLTATPSSRPSSSTATTLPTLTFLTTLMQSITTCRQPLAQPLLATGLSQRSANIGKVARSNKGARRASLEGGMKRRSRSLRSRQTHGRRKESLALRRVFFRLLNSVGS
ncbi:hypothetical protein PMIN06_009479 [Paraphaeosphaeria minitans]|uniref:Transcriptional activator hac1 n=1 Tax=Paraphaeosphaeria minitans TaxID=565426 RepID=A0A9P6KVD2_9PLEO|nr:transcriptional activator hac1 [Paraphaeosphaeria minitans]